LELEQAGTTVAVAAQRAHCRRPRKDSVPVDVPVQYYQSIIAIELTVAGALLFQIRFFVPREDSERAGEHLPDPWIRLVMAIIVGATLFGSLAAMLHDAPKPAAIAITVGLVVSLLPILLRALPPLRRGSDSGEAGRNVAITIIGLLLYLAITAGAVILVAV
jgi:hypothetical protein